MAVTKTIKVVNHLHRVVDYATNEKKTGLDAAVSYITNPDKTEKRLYEFVLNCESVDTAYTEMQATKERWGKKGGVLAYHIIQSFKPGEITPEKAHQIGVEFARQCFGDKYEVVIGTHLDRRHLHNHVVINSVSFVDGYKYRNNFEDYFYKIRGISDKLCHENRLSVIDPQGRGKNYAEWRAEQQGKPTIRSIIRAEVDEVIERSFTFKTFIDELKKKGFTVKYGDKVKYIAIKPPNSEKYIRLRSLGEDYTEDAIKLRLQTKQATGGYKPIPVPPTKHYRIVGSFNRGAFKGKKLHGFHALYFHYLYLLGKVKKRKTPGFVSAYMRTELLKFDRYKEQFQFLRDKEIETQEDLSARKDSLINQISSTSDHRKELYQKRSDATCEQEKEGVSEEIATINQTLRILRQELRLCNGIEENTAEMQKRLQEARQQTSERKEELDHEPRSRSR